MHTAENVRRGRLEAGLVVLPVDDKGSKVRARTQTGGGRVREP